VGIYELKTTIGTMNSELIFNCVTVALLLVFTICISQDSGQHHQDIQGTVYFSMKK